MMSLLHRALPWWRERSGREQVLILIAGAIAALLIAWYGIAAPLRHAAASAQVHRLEAERQLQEIEIMVERMKSGGATAADLAQTVETSAAQSGLALASQAREGDEIVVRFGAADPATLFAWIRKMKDMHGIVVINLTATRVSGGLLEAEAVLTQGGS